LSVLHEEVNGAPQGKGALFEQHRLLAEIGHRLLPLVENPEVPGQQFPEVVVGSFPAAVLQLRARLADTLGQLALALGEALDPGDDRGTVLVDDVQGAAKKGRQLGVDGILGLRLREVLDQLFGLVQRRAPCRQPGGKAADLDVAQARGRVGLRAGPARRGGD